VELRASLDAAKREQAAAEAGVELSPILGDGLMGQAAAVWA
jgi:hypothetical protein